MFVRLLPVLLFLVGLVPVFAQSPVIGVAKDASISGREVTFTFYLENLGDEGLTNISLPDDLDAVLGAGAYSISAGPFLDSGPAGFSVNGSFDGSSDTELIGTGALDVGETAVIIVTAEMNSFPDLGSGSGVYSNQVTVTADGSMASVNDLSDHGTDPDPDGNGAPNDAGEDDATPIIFNESPIIGAAKNALLSGSQVSFVFYLENLGNVTLSNISLPDDLDAVFGAGNYSVISGPTFIDNPMSLTLNAGFDGSSDTELIDSGSLAVDDTASFQVVVNVTNVTDQGSGLGVYENQVTVSGQSPGGKSYSDLSDSGGEPDANGDDDPKDSDENDPTVFVIGEEPAIGVSKTATVNDSLVTFDYYVENLGNVDLILTSFADDLDAVFGAGNYVIDAGPTLIADPGDVFLNGSFDGSENSELLDESGSLLAVGATAQIQVDVLVLSITDQGAGIGNYSNQVSVFSETAAGSPAFDISDDAVDPDTDGDGNANEDGENDSTDFSVGEVAVIGLAKDVIIQGAFVGNIDVNGMTQAASGIQITVMLYLENLGNVTLSNLSLIDDLEAVFGAGNFGTVSGSSNPEIFIDPGTINRNNSYNGAGLTDVLSAGSTLAPGEMAGIRFHAVVTNLVDNGSGLGVYENQASVSADGALGGMASDLSDAGSTPDADDDRDPTEAGENDPTAFVLGSNLGVAKTALVAGNEVTFDLYIESFGSTTLSNLSLNENLDSVFGTSDGTSNYTLISGPTLIDDPMTITLNPAWDGSADTELFDAGSTIDGDSTAQIQFVVQVDKLANINGGGIGNYTNSVLIAATQPGGTELFDLSDDGTDPDPNGDGDPSSSGEDTATTFTVTSDAVTGVGLVAAIATNQVTFDVYLENFGGSVYSDMSLPFDLDGLFGAGNYTVDVSPNFIDDPGTIGLNGGYDGSSDTELFSAGSTLNGLDTAQIQLVVSVDTVIDGGSGTGVYSAQIILTGNDPNGIQICDYSDDSTDPDTSGDGDPTAPGLADPPVDGENDETVFVVGDAVLGAALNSFVSGNNITYDYYLENLGDVPITSISISQNLFSVFGFGNYSVLSQPSRMEGPSTISPVTSFDGTFAQTLLVGGSLDVGESARIRFAITVTNVVDQQSNGLGTYSTSFTVNGLSPTGAAVTDTSDDGIVTDSDGDGNPDEAGENDPTFSILGEEVAVGIAKDVSTAGLQVTFDYYLENLAASTVSSLSFSDNLDDVFGAGNYSINSGPTLLDDPGTLTLNGSYDGTTDSELLVPGSSSLATTATAQIQLVVDVTNIVDLGDGLGKYENQVTLLGAGPSATATGDVSDFGTDPDPNGDGNPSSANESDITTFSLSTSGVGIAKNATVDGESVTFDYYIENMGNDDLDTYSITDDFDAVFGAGNYEITSALDLASEPRNLVPNSNFDGSTDTELVASGSQDSGILDQFQVVVHVNRLIDGGSGLGVYSNQVTVNAESGSGSVSDLSDSGTNPDPDGDGSADGANEDDPTVFTIPENPVIGVAKTAAVVGRTVTFDYYFEGWGNVDLENISLIEDLDAVFGAGNYTVSAAPAWIVDPGTINLDAGFDGSANNDLFAAGSTLALRGSGQLQIEVTVTTVTDQGFGFGIFENQALISAESPDGSSFSDYSDDGTEPDSDDNDLPDDIGEDDATSIVLNGEIGDLVWNDLNGDGVVDAGEPGLSGVTVFLDDNSNGALDMGESSTTTDANGNYVFEDLPSGSYTVAIDEATITTGFVLITTEPLAVTLLDGEVDNTVDFGYQQQDATIGDYVWNDLDGDGVQDAGESGISGVTVFLDLNSNGTLDAGEPSDVTDANGAYDFTDLATGTYAVTVDETTVTAGFVLTGGSNPHSATIAAGEDYNDADFGYQQQDATIGDFVWNDLNGDGVQDAGEPGISGVTVFLDLNSNGSLDAGEPNDTTDVNGAYDITGLPLGTYSVTVDTTTVTAGFVLTGGSNPQSVTIVAGQDYNDADFGFQQQDATIGDFVWNDLDGDGVQDAGEPGISGVTVYLDLNDNGSLDAGEPSDSTDVNGAYDITDLATGTYSVTVDTSTVTTGFVQTGGSNPQSVTIAAGEDYNDADFGYQQQDASIGDFVWNDLNGDGVQDAGEPGIAGVTVFLDLNSNGSLDAGEPSDTTDANGAYDFTDLATGTYSVMVDESTVTTGFVLTGGSNPHSATIAAGEDYNDADFGYQQQDATIGDFVWNDLNGDGVQDAGEPGISGVTVFLDLNSNGSLDAGEPSDVTDANGAYDFTDLATGTYSVTVDETTVTTGFVLTGGSNPHSAAIAAGEDYNDADFGYQQQDATIGDFVWNDLNGDGVQDAGEPGIAGVTVYLDLNSNGSLDAGEPNDVTDANGAYDITDLPLGTYAVTVDETTVTTGFVRTGGANPQSVTIAAGDDYNDADFGYQQQDATIGDFIWNDLNGDGVQDAGEPGLQGIMVFLDKNANGTQDAGEPDATSDANGAYDFTDLPTGNYQVVLVSATVPTGFVQTGGTSTQAVSLAAGEDYNDADFGFQQQDATIGDFVWNDLNGDGVQDAGEPGIAGVSVFLDLNSNGSLDAGEPSATTDANGAYDFTDLATGTYAVTVDSATVTTGFVLTGGSNPHSAAIAAGEDYNDADFGYQQQDATIGDFVWNDLNGDGVQDAGEPGMAGVTVYLDMNSNGSFDAGEPSDVTDANGAFDITDLPLGTYAVTVDESTVTTGFVVTGGTNPQSVTIAAGDDYNDADFGFQQQDATIGDFVWNDLNGDGVQDAGEPGLAGVTVFLDLNSNGSLDAGEPNATTDANGAYDITDLPLGTYSVVVDTTTVTTGFVLITANQPLSVTIAAGEDYNNADFGYQQQDAVISDFVWNDLNGDGVQDAGEPGISGYSVFMDDNSNGTLDAGEASTTSDANGLYSFSNLAAGTYTIAIDTSTVTTGFVQTGGTNPQSVTITEGEVNTSTDFGFQQQDASIGDRIWVDLNGNGTQEPGETGNLPGYTVWLDTNNNGVLDAGESSMVTDANGAYDFTDLPTGTYTVRVDETPLPVGWALTTANNPMTVNLAAGEDFNTADFGYQQQDASIGDTVWHDENGNGVFDAGEPGFANVTMDLIQIFIIPGEDSYTIGPLLASVATDANGNYLFENLEAGGYLVRVTDLNNVLTGYDSTTGPPVALKILEEGEAYLDADFGYCQKPEIVTQPIDVTECEGTEVSFTVVATGSDLSYQWYKDDVLIGGATDATYTIASVVSSDAGDYYCVVSNACDEDVSQVATLDVPAVMVHIADEHAQGLEPTELTADFSCGVDPVTWDWRNLRTGEIFGANMNPVVVPLQPTTTYIEVRVTDALGSTGRDITVILVGEDPAYQDFNGDGCNTIDDLWGLAIEWQEQGVDSFDANGDGRINILDYLYINTSEAACE